MSNLTKRLDDLERAANPPAELPLIVAYKDDDIAGGKIWLTDNIDYRASIGGTGSREITPAELAELEKTHRVILVNFVDMPEGITTPP